MKKLFFTALCLLFALMLPLFCFADGNQAPPDENTFSRIMNVIWYVILAVLFGGGLILVSKWSKRINERDAELASKLAEQQAEKEAESKQEEQDDTAPCENEAPKKDLSEN